MGANCPPGLGLGLVQNCAKTRRQSFDSVRLAVIAVAISSDEGCQSGCSRSFFGYCNWLFIKIKQ
jgi:hypothetical protein